jgi:mono/diheme cytochrome c family protein
MYYPTALLLATFTAVNFSALAAPDLSKLPPAAKREGVTYAKDIRPIFEASCLRCHGEQRPKAGLRLDSLESVLKGSKEGQVVLPGKGAESKLVLAVARVDERSAMPPKPREGRRGGPGGPSAKSSDDGKAKGQTDGGNSQTPNAPQQAKAPAAKNLTTEQVALVRAWVDQGAK